MTTLTSIHPLALAAAYLCTAKKDPRYYLQGIAIQPSRDSGANIIATDGHIMLVIHDPNGVCDKDMIVSLPSPAITQCKGKKAGSVATIEQTGTDLLLRLPLSVHAVELVDARFPDWRAVMPAALPTGQPKLPTQPALLGRLAAAAGLLACGDQPGLGAGVSADDSSCICYQLPAMPDGLTGRAVVMPLVRANVSPWLDL